MKTSKWKPREWWMRFDRDGNHDIGSAFRSLECCKDLSEEYWNKEITHVIEYSAYTQILRRCRELEAIFLKSEEKK